MNRSRKNDKKLVAMRLSREPRAVLDRVAKRTGKTKTRVMEEALLSHGQTVGV